MLLQCTRDFNEGGFICRAGDVVDVIDHTGHYLLSNYPVAFSPAPGVAVSPPDPVGDPDVDGVTVSLDAPPADKMVKRAPRKK